MATEKREKTRYNMEKEIVEKNKISGFGKAVNFLRCFFEYVTNFSLIIYLVLALILKWGNFTVNLVLGVITCILTVFCIIYNRGYETKEETVKSKRKYQNVKHIIKAVRILTKAYLLGVLIYGFCISFPKVDLLSIITIFWVLFTWINLIFFEIITLIIHAISRKRDKRKLEKKELALKKA